MMGFDFLFGILVGGLIFGTAALFIGAASQDDADDQSGPDAGC